MPDVFVYKNLKTGESFAFGSERPDLEARPNWERTDDDAVPELVKETVQAGSTTAQLISDAAKPVDPDETAKDAGGLGGTRVEESVADVIPSPEPGKGYGGVLSRNVVVTKSRAVHEAEAAADTESLALHGTLAANADGSQTRVRVDALNADVVNAPPVGDPSKSPVAKRAAQAKKAGEQERKKADDVAADKAKQAKQGTGGAAAAGARQQSQKPGG